MFTSHDQLYMYGLSAKVNLLGSAPGTAMHSRVRETRVTTKDIKDLKKQTKITWFIQKMCFYLTFAIHIRF